VSAVYRRAALFANNINGGTLNDRNNTLTVNGSGFEKHNAFGSSGVRFKGSGDGSEPFVVPYNSDYFVSWAVPNCYKALLKAATVYT